ncbi:MAG: ABC transporter permease [Lachnospiraceae bacterium]|nr:ABC transporter permease [Lachnospiraceae bacterium]
MNTKAQKEPLIHLTKRGAMPVYKAMIIRALAVVLALIVCAVITGLTTGIDPIAVYTSIISGAFGTARKTWITLQDVSILLTISLALTLAFRMRFWNIGGEGQVLMGGLGAAACMICIGDRLPAPVLILLMLISSLTLGALWGLIPAVCKAVWNTNETLSTLMMNYIATQIVLFFTILWEVPKGSGKIGIINQDSHAGWLPQIFGSKYLLPIIIATAITVFVYIYIKYTKHGYEIRVVGESPRTSIYVGINVKKVIIRTMIVSGAICGLVGLILVGGINHTLTATISDGRGFTAVLVSWMAQFNPFAMILTSFVIVFMDRGAGEIATQFDLNQSFGDILTGIILFFIIGCEFFINYQIRLRKKGHREA